MEPEQRALGLVSRLRSAGMKRFNFETLFVTAICLIWSFFPHTYSSDRPTTGALPMQTRH
jgi:hypothetical protein